MQLPKFPHTKNEWKAALSTNSSKEKSSQWINKDLAPTPKAARTWSWYAPLLSDRLWWAQTHFRNRISLSSYWWGVRYPFQVAFCKNWHDCSWRNASNASQWSNGASLISVGLNWWQALISCMLVSNIKFYPFLSANMLLRRIWFLLLLLSHLVGLSQIPHRIFSTGSERVWNVWSILLRLGSCSGGYHLVRELAIWPRIC